MEAAESPLEVLSRAAVMLQRNVLPPPSYDEARSLSQHQQQQKQKRKPPTNDTSFTPSTTTYDNGNSSGKWKREKKYQHKTSTTLVCDSTSVDLKSSSRFPSNNRCSLENEAEPLDMSKRTVTKERGEPPSYFQSILCSNYGRRQTGVPAVIFPSIDKTSTCTSSSPTTLSDDKEAMCDQVINEHFRRSLGRDYLNVFSTSKVTSREVENERLIESRSPLKVERSDEEIEMENARCISPSPLSVDDHFAKALGETWIKLQQQQKQNENQNKSSVRNTLPDVDES